MVIGIVVTITEWIMFLHIIFLTSGLFAVGSTNVKYSDSSVLPMQVYFWRFAFHSEGFFRNNKCTLETFLEMRENSRKN